MNARTLTPFHLEDLDASPAELLLRVEQAEAERDRWRILAGGGCDANQGGEHDIETQEGYSFCCRCGETITSSKERVRRLIDRNIQLDNARVQAERLAEQYLRRATDAEGRCAELEKALDRCVNLAINSSSGNR